MVIRDGMTAYAWSGLLPEGGGYQAFQDMSPSVRDGERDYLNGELLLRQVSTYATPTDAFAGLRETDEEGRIKSNSTDPDERDPDFEVTFVDGDGKDPRQWPRYKRMYHLGTLSYMVTVVALYSTSYTSGLPGIVQEFGVTRLVATLGLTTYLFGLAIGGIFLAPLSEMYGRQPIYLITYSLFLVLIIPSAVATNFTGLVLPRFFAGIFASAALTNGSGTVSDITTPRYLALAFGFYSIGPINGPVFGPIVGGFAYQYLGWRWTVWLVLIFAGAGMAMLVLCRETYPPVILRQMAFERRKETGDERWWSRYDEKKDLIPLLKVNLSRPLVMLFTEPICIFWDFYVGFVYGVLYLCFVAYPIVFQQERGWQPGLAGLAFGGIGVGSLITIFSEPLIRKIIDAHKADPETGRPPPEAVASIVSAGGVLLAVGELMFAWTCTPNVHWIAPMIAGIPFGAGNTIVFIYSGNYLIQAYGSFAASALAGNALLRSVMGAVLPLAGAKLYHTLGSNWAGTLLGLLEAVFIPIPVVFYFYGHRLRKASSMISEAQKQR